MNINNFETFIPTSKLKINKSIIDDFRLMNKENIDDNLYIFGQNIYNFVFEFNLKNKFKNFNIKYLDLLSLFCKKNNISNSIKLDKNNDFIIELNLISYSYNIEIKTKKLLYNNLIDIFDDIYNVFESDISKINIYINSLDIYNLIDNLIRTNIFKKLDLNIYDFFNIFNIEYNNDLKLNLALVKTKYLNNSKLLNINITGASDILDIKKDVEFIINNLDKNFSKIVSYYRIYNLCKDNILYNRIKKLIDLNLLNIYSFFMIDLSLLNIIMLFKISKNIDLISKMIRIFKLIKSLKLHENDLIKDSFSNLINIDDFYYEIEHTKIKDQDLTYKSNFINSFKEFIKRQCNNYSIDGKV